jgi:hypothetical protein
MATKPMTQFVSRLGPILLCTDYPSLTSGTVFFGTSEPGSNKMLFHAVEVNTQKNAFGEMSFSAPTAKMAGKMKIEPDYINFNNWAYHQSEPFTGELIMYDWTKIDRSAYPSYPCRQFVQGKNDNLFVYVIAQVGVLYSEFVVFIGSGQVLCEVPQYLMYNRTRSSDYAYITLDASTIQKLGLSLSPGNYPISTNDGTWNFLNEVDFEITINGMTGTIVPKR